MNFKESKAIYLQIADRICDEILAGAILRKRSAFRLSENMLLLWR